MNINELEENYCKAANAISEYRHAHGFEPGVKVIYTDDGIEKQGIIAEYGDIWRGFYLSIPVLFDGKMRVCSMPNLTVVDPT